MRKNCNSKVRLNITDAQHGNAEYVNHKINLKILIVLLVF